MTFDTSVVDVQVQRSFSSTETNTSASTGKENMLPSEDSNEGLARHGSPYKEVSTDELYDQWASTYDTDGNILQFVDDLQMRNLMEQFVRLCSSRTLANDTGRLDILDLGCGTGRNTLKLLQSPWPSSVETFIYGWDGSQAMLDIGRSKCADVHHSTPDRQFGALFEVVDISDPANVPEQCDSFFSGLISTLVLEHIKIETYFAITARVLKPGGYALITNMHSDMGRLSRAGYKTASGERIKGTSYIYTPAETVEAAAAAGLELVGEAGEAAVDEWMFGEEDVGHGEWGKVAERARKWVGTKVWYGMVLRKR